MHAFLIVGNTKDARQNDMAKRIAKWQISSWDMISLPADAPTIGIEDIRDFQRALALAPQNSPAKVGVLHDIHRLTSEAQNALLKTLEEPPPNTYLLAETSTPDVLLSTILSRFSLVSIGTNDTVDQTTIEEYEKIITELFSATPGRSLQLLEKYAATREDAKIFVENALFAARSLLLTGDTKEVSSKKVAQLIHHLFAAQTHLSVNVNPKLVIDNTVLQIIYHQNHKDV